MNRIQIVVLRIYPEKCFMLKTEVKVLGHIISSKGIKTDQTKIETVQEFERSKCDKTLWSF